MFTRRTPELAPQPPRGLLAGKSIDNPSTNVSPLLSSPSSLKGCEARVCATLPDHADTLSAPRTSSRSEPPTPSAALVRRRVDGLARRWAQLQRGQNGMSAEGARSPPQSSPPADILPPMGKGGKDGRVFSPSPGSTVAPTGILYQASLSHLKEKDNDEEGS